jgi:hypothetical protein
MNKKTKLRKNMKLFMIKTVSRRKSRNEKKFTNNPSLPQGHRTDCFSLKENKAKKLWD